VFDSGWDAGLDEAQLAAAEHGSGPLVVVAGAGTGKTRMLTARVARLLERGVAPERLLLLTFTRRAADDMLGRATALAGCPAEAARLRGGTFHAVAHQLIRAHCETLGLPAGFSVLDPGDAADLMDLLRDAHGLTGTDVRLPRAATLVDVYSRCVNVVRTVEEVVKTTFPWCEPHIAAIAELCRAYVEHKRRRGQVDFDDLLLYWRAALGDGHLGPVLSSMFDFVLVDEYQDVNALQVDIVRALCPRGEGLTVVGDDAQAVYGFRGADAAHLHELAAALPGTTVMRLERNFRSTQPILDVANAVRPHHAGPVIVLQGSRTGGCRPILLRCHDAPSEARAVATRILAAHEQGLRLRDQAVLVRTGHHSDLIEVELSARRVPYRKYGGLRFVESAHVRDYVATARLLDNPSDDIAWLRLLRLHDGIGPARARAVLAAMGTDDGTTDPAARAVAAAPPRARVALGETLGRLAAARALSEPRRRPGAVLELVGPLVLARYTDGTARLGDLQRLAGAAEATGDLGRWLAEVTLDPPVSTGTLAGPPHLDDDYVTISTVHSAKGLEWPVVHLPHLVDGAFPSDMALSSSAGLAEEHRLFYVATTRARDQLFLYAPLRMPHHRHARDDRHSLAQPSRFLDQRAMATLAVEEEVPHRPTMVTVGPGSAGSVRVDLDGLWR
jgi:DNA helicase-2/ATP-dependent DNA helicase PcrA